MKRVLTVFMVVIFIISSLSVPAFADELTGAEGNVPVETSENAQTDSNEDEQQNEGSADDSDIQLGDDVPGDTDSDASDKTLNEETNDEETGSDLFGEGWIDDDTVINLFELGSGYYDSELFEANPKVFVEDFEGGFDVSSLGVDIDTVGQIDYKKDISVIKGKKAKFGDNEDEIGIEDFTTGSKDGSFLMWTNRETDSQNIFKFFDVFNRDGLTHADKNDKYALRFKLYIPRVDGLARDRVQIVLGTYSPMLYAIDSETGAVSYPSADPTQYTTEPKQSNTLIVPTGKWVDVFWDNNGAGLVPGQLIVNQLGISSRMVFTTMYIDDLTVVRKEKVSDYTVNSYDMQPFDAAEYTKTGTEVVNDEELGKEVLKLAPGGSLKFSSDNLVRRFIADRGEEYKINFKTRNATQLKVSGTSVYVDRSVMDGTDYKTVIKTDDFVMTENASSADGYKEHVVIYKENGVKDAVEFGGKKADIFRALDFTNESADQDAYIYDITVSKINKFSPMAALNSEFDDWGWIDASLNAPNISYNDGKLQIDALLTDGEQSISTLVSLIKGAKYQVNFKAVSADGETLKIEMVDPDNGKVLHTISKKLTGKEEAYFSQFTMKGNYADNVSRHVYFRIAATDKYVTVSDLKISLISDLVELDSSDDDTIRIYGNLKDYAVNNPKAYLLLNSYDYKNDEAVKATASLFLNPDGTYEVLFEDIQEFFSEKYYNDIYVVIDGIEGIPFIAKTMKYESAKFKADLIKRIAGATNYREIAEVITGKSGNDDVKNDVILCLNGLDYYKASTSYVDPIAKVLFGKKSAILNPDNHADCTALQEEYLFAATVAGANTKKLSNAKLIDYTARLAERIDYEDEAVYNNFYTSFDDEDKQKVMDIVKKMAYSENCLDEESYKNVFIDSIFKSMIVDHSVTYSDVMTHITNYKSFLGIDDEEWGHLTKLKKTKYYTEAQTLISNYAKKTDDIHTIGDNIESLVKKAKKNIDGKRDNGPTGGGGGGTPVSSTPIVSTQITVNTDKYDPKPTVSFTDLGGFDWAKDYIDELISTGAVAGYDDGTFRPANNITRTEFAKILSVALDVYDEKAKCDYSDIPVDNWGYAYVGSLAKLDVIKGKPDGSFGSNDHITRQDVAVLVYRLVNKLGIKLPVVNRPEAFADDSQISDYAKEAVNALYQAGVISGVGDYRFDPMGYANRAQAAKIIAFFVK